jgi:hypothetical protein
MSKPSPSATDPAVDNPVCLAFQLGWDMSCLYHQAHPRHHARLFRVTAGNTYPKLPAQRDFTGSERTERRIVAVSAGLFRLSTSFERAGFQAPTVERVQIAFDSNDRRALKEAAYFLHISTLLLLQAADARLGSAYNLGRALMATGTAATSDELKDRFRRGRIDGLRDELDDLVSALPDHASRAVGTSLCWWQCALAPKLMGLQPGNVPRLAKKLDRQVDMWRALLSGEKHGPDMLSAEDYTSAAGRLLNHAGSIARTVLRRHWRPLLTALGMLVGIIALAIAVGGVEGTLAAIAGAAAVFGISWKSIGSTVGTVTTQLQGPLWHAELDRAIAVAITHKPVRKTYDRLPDKDRRCDAGR